MAFTVPTFNLLCNLYAPPAAMTPGVPVGAPRVANVPCALVYGRRVQVMSTGGTGDEGIPLQSLNLLVAAGTDIRGRQDATTFDIVEIPPLSQQWYYCGYVLDIGKGWANEHRSVAVTPVFNTWTPPYV